MTDFLTKEEAKAAQDACYKTNIRPIMNELKELKTDLKGFGKEFNDFKTELKEIVAVIPYQIHESIIEEADRKYASKLTQRMMYGLATIILIAFIGGLVTLVIK